MAITAEQAAQLASTYQAGDTSGLQGLVSSMGVTAGDVAQYFPGFDVGSLQGITLAPSAPAAPVAPPAPTYGTGKLTGDVISNYIASNLQNPELIAQKAKEFGISALDIQKAAGYTPEQQARFFSYAGVTPTGIAGLTPLSYGDKGQFTAKEVMDYVNRYIDDPTRIYQAAQQYKVTPEQLQTLYTGSATPYALGDIKKYFETGKTGFGSKFEDILGSTFGSTKERSDLESSLGLKPGTLGQSFLSPTRYSGMSVENIEKTLQESSINKIQEAARVRNFAENFYGLSSDKARQMFDNLLAGKDTDDFAEKLYGDLLKGGYDKDLQTKILQDAAVRSPKSPFFAKNPEQLLYYSPIGEKKAVGENSNQYGIDPKTGLPFIHLGAVNNTMGDEVYVRPFREEKGQGELGYHPHSTYAGYIARGVGIFGSKASQSDINYFDKIEREIAKLGGVKTETTTDPETGQKYTNNYVNVQETDPESGQKYTRKVNVESLFAQPEEDFKQTRTYKEYLDTQNALRTAAAKAGIPETKYTSTKQAYEDLNNRFKDLYVIQGRTDTLDPAAAKTLGIPDVKDNSKHATLLYQAVGDKLVPFTDPKTGLPQTVLKTFDFKDPNTTRGFFGDLANAAANILSVPPIAMALSAATGGISNLFSFATQPVVSTLVNAGVNELAANAITNAAVNSLLTEAMGGNAGDTFLSSLVSGAIGGTKGLPGLGEQFLNQIGFNNLGIADLVDPSTLGRFAGTYAGSALTGTDPTKMLINQAITQGIKSLPGMSRIGSPIQSSFEDLQSGGEGFKLSEAEKARLDAEVASLGNDQRIQGILGLPIKVEQDIITAVKELVPLLTAKGLTKQEATLLASNIIGAARSA